MDVSSTRKVCLMYPFAGLFFIFILFLTPFKLCSQTVNLHQTCNESKSWIARWTIQSSFSGPGRPYNMVDGRKDNFNTISTDGPWAFNVNLGLIRHISGIKIYSGSEQYSPHNYQISVSKDNQLFSVIKSGNQHSTCPNLPQ